MKLKTWFYEVEKRGKKFTVVSGILVTATTHARPFSAVASRSCGRKDRLQPFFHSFVTQMFRSK